MMSGCFHDLPSSMSMNKSGTPDEGGRSDRRVELRQGIAFTAARGMK